MMETFNVRRNANSGQAGDPRWVLVPMLGTRIDEHFAWTPSPDVNNPAGKRSTITHLPTGGALRCNVTNIGAAKRVVGKFRALKQVDWGESDLDELSRAVQHERNVELLSEARSYDGSAPKEQNPPGAFEWLAAKKEWRGAQIVGKEMRPGFGECIKVLHPASGATAYLLAEVRQ